MHQVRRKDSFCEELEQIANIFLSSIRKFSLEILMQNWGDRISSNQQLGMTVYIRIAMTMVLK